MSDLDNGMSVVDLFAGAGGWDVAARRLGFDPVGYELDDDCVATRQAADMPTVRWDLSNPTALKFRAAAQIASAGPEGLIASPPCQSFSQAGKRSGLADDRGQLVWVPLTWAEELCPTWCAWEQVPDVLPIWRQCARRLEDLGYFTATGLVHAEQFGVPQTRTRAILLASRERRVSLPEPTHQRYVSGVPQGDPEACGEGALFGEPLNPWVSMADALGWGMTERPSVTLAPGTGSGGPDFGGDSGARAIVASERDEGRWLGQKMNAGVGIAAKGNEVTRPVDHPAPTVGTKSASQWYVDRPATTVTTDSRIATPGHHDENTRSFGEGAIRLTVEQAAALQTFPDDHPWRGSNTSIHRQIGNAVPPMLAEALLAQVVDGSPLVSATREATS